MRALKSTADYIEIDTGTGPQRLKFADYRGSRGKKAADLKAALQALIDFRQSIADLPNDDPDKTATNAELAAEYGERMFKDRDDLVSSIDLVPTMLAAAGADIPADLPGLNLLDDRVSGEKIGRERIFGEGFAHDIADIEKPNESLLYRWCIEGKWKLLLTYDGEVAAYKSTHPRTEKRPQLFDLLADPAEKNNLAGANPEVVARLVKQIDDWYPVKERKVIKTFK